MASLLVRPEEGCVVLVTNCVALGAACARTRATRLPPMGTARLAVRLCRHCDTNGEGTLAQRLAKERFCANAGSKTGPLRREAPIWRCHARDAMTGCLVHNGAQSWPVQSAYILCERVSDGPKTPPNSGKSARANMPLRNQANVTQSSHGRCAPARAPQCALRSSAVQQQGRVQQAKPFALPYRAAPGKRLLAQRPCGTTSNRPTDSKSALEEIQGRSLSSIEVDELFDVESVSWMGA